jgi:hypothetical protein
VGTLQRIEIVPVIKSVLLLCIFLVSCEGSDSAKPASDIVDKFSDERYALLTDRVPDRFARFSSRSLANSREQGVLKADMVFESADISPYSGRPFSVRAFVECYEENDERNNLALFLMETRTFWQSSYSRQEPIEILIESDSAYIGKVALESTLFVDLTPIYGIGHREFIKIDEKEAVMFQRKYPPRPEMNMLEVVEYNTNLLALCAIKYQILFETHEEFSHLQFLYVKRFVEDFYR